MAALGQELFAKLALAQDMEARQVHSLLVEPLQALLDDPRGPASASKIYAAFSNASTDYYDALNEFLALVGVGGAVAAPSPSSDRNSLSAS